ncbi:hypothetical protein GOBAR_AA15031 [Gossypium barbadense]|uniref:Uncharacterized protein n=1 Tax=Gossypium barbadense TaxID=3634 RepID=A0A2P5XQL4_GOSBA|nr:hypothetical protein GOBAR_AA15031 [Gossypium barbadense]
MGIVLHDCRVDDLELRSAYILMISRPHPSSPPSRGTSIDQFLSVGLTSLRLSLKGVYEHRRHLRCILLMEHAQALPN